MNNACVKRKQGLRTWLICLLLFCAIPLLLHFAQEIMTSIRHALQLCVQVIIPSLFPFMILSEWLISLLPLGTANGHGSSVLNAICRKIFGVSSIGLLPFLMGAACGFPIGVKCTVDLYRRGRLTKAEAEQALAFSNNTGPAFIIAGVGYGLLGDQRLGLLLYLLQIVSALASGCILAKIFPRDKVSVYREASPSGGGEDGLPGAVKRSSLAMLFVCGMILAFSVPISLLSLVVEDQALLSFFSSFLEIGSATALAAKLYRTSGLTALLALTNAICFAGLSVHLQAALFAKEEKLSLRRHTAGKLLQSVIACGIVLLSALK